METQPYYIFFIVVTSTIGIVATILNIGFRYQKGLKFSTLVFCILPQISAGIAGIALIYVNSYLINCNKEDYTTLVNWSIVFNIFYNAGLGASNVFRAFRLEAIVEFPNLLYTTKEGDLKNKKRLQLLKILISEKNVLKPLSILILILCIVYTIGGEILILQSPSCTQITAIEIIDFFVNICYTICYVRLGLIARKLANDYFGLKKFFTLVHFLLLLSV